ncbi:MAG: DUF3552 domain-containing protein, partial [Anaerolineales bacterium]|nr:DUF3552 domain-containing protein [Anaerolineales bacterium]
MPNLVWGLLGGLVVGALLAGLGVYFFLKPKTEAVYKQAEEDIANRKNQADLEAQNLVRDAQNESRQTRQEAEKAIERRYADLARAEERVDKRAASQDVQRKKFELREQQLNRRQSKLDKRQNEINNIEQQRIAELERIAALTQDEAKGMLLEAAEVEARQDMARVMREIEEKAKENAEEKARKLVALAIQRVASDHVSDIAVSVVALPSDEMKGRIIGRSGRNIRAFEQAAGVDVVVDDTPEAVTISSFDPIRREVARRGLAKLITDGRIHPARIEKVIKDAKA